MSSAPSSDQRPLALLGQRTALIGLVLYVAFVVAGLSLLFDVRDRDETLSVGAGRTADPVRMRGRTLQRVRSRSWPRRCG